jgi:hypothetical protein
MVVTTGPKTLATNRAVTLQFSHTRGFQRSIPSESNKAVSSVANISERNVRSGAKRLHYSSGDKRLHYSSGGKRLQAQMETQFGPKHRCLDANATHHHSG